MSHTKLLVIFLETKSPLKYIFSTYSPSWSKSVLQNVRDMATVINKLQVNLFFNFPWFQRFFLWFSFNFLSLCQKFNNTDWCAIHQNRMSWLYFLLFYIRRISHESHNLNERFEIISPNLSLPFFNQHIIQVHRTEGSKKLKSKILFTKKKLRFYYSPPPPR